MKNDPAIEIDSGYWLTATTPCWRCGHSAAFAVLVATSGREFEDGDACVIDEPFFINAPGDLPASVIAQVQSLVPYIEESDDDPDSCLTNRCSYCEARLGDWHLCKIGGALIAEDGTAVPGTKATRLAGTPFALSDCGVHYTDVQAVLDSAQMAD